MRLTGRQALERCRLAKGPPEDWTLSLRERQVLQQGHSWPLASLDGLSQESPGTTAGNLLRVIQEPLGIGAGSVTLPVLSS